MTTTATPLTLTTTLLPEDGVRVEWFAEDGRCVRGYCFGNIWVETHPDGPVYHKKPASWRYASR